MGHTWNEKGFVDGLGHILDGHPFLGGQNHNI